MTEFVQILPWKSVLESMLDASRPSSIIVAPNFEDRSIALAQTFCERAGAVQSQNRWHIITLQGQNEYDARDYIKARNCNRVYETLTDSGFVDGENLFLQRVMNPANEDELRVLLGSATDGMGEDFTLIVDVSAIPRAFLWQLISALSPERSNVAGFIKPKRLLLAYSWAKDYSPTLEFETTGSIIDSVSARPLEQIVSRSASIDAVIFTSGNTRNAYMAVQLISSFAHKKEFFVELVHFVRPRGFARSWHHLKLHQELLGKRPSTDRMANSFVFHVEHALAWLRALSEKSFKKLKERRDHSFIIAPNGPKIVSILAQFVADEYIARIVDDRDLSIRLRDEGRSPKDCVSVLSTRGSQFLSIYSLGVDGEMSCVEVLA
jgi:hypothetical protein